MARSMVFKEEIDGMEDPRLKNIALMAMQSPSLDIGQNAVGMGIDAYNTQQKKPAFNISKENSMSFPIPNGAQSFPVSQTPKVNNYWASPRMDVAEQAEISKLNNEAEDIAANAGYDMPYSDNPSVNSVMQNVQLPEVKKEESSPWYNTGWGRGLLGGGLSALGVALTGGGLNNAIGYGLIGGGQTAKTLNDNRLVQQKLAMDEANKKAVIDLQREKMMRESSSNQNDDKKNIAEERQRYINAQSSIPKIMEEVSKLKRLNKVATDSGFGRAWDGVNRFFGQANENAVAYSEMENIIENNVLPQLRAMLGAQFTEREGERVKATIMNPKLTEAEREAQLNNYVATKIREIDQSRRRLEMYGIPIPESAYSSEDLLSGLGIEGYQPQNNTSDIGEGTIIENDNGDRMMMRGGQWQAI